MKTEPDTMRFRLCSLLKYLGGRGKLRFLRTGMFFQNIPVLRSAYFHKEYTVLFAPKRSTFRFAARTLRVQGSRRATPQALRGDERFFQEQDR